MSKVVLYDINPEDLVVNVNDKLLTEYGYDCAERASILQFMAGYSVEEAEKLAIEEYNRKQKKVS